jgi:hypothetical protein
MKDRESRSFRSKMSAGIRRGAVLQGTPENKTSEAIDGGLDPEMLLAECERLGLEGIVSKRKDAGYRSGRCDWIKVKTRAWREANRYRGELFNQR